MHQKLIEFETVVAELAVVDSHIQDLEIIHVKFKNNALASAIANLKIFKAQLLEERELLRQGLLHENAG